ncbi:MAG: lysylphosphatidylglycerol synthase transmembrane domain-containing protein [Planctomycetota bacterium]
MRTPQRGPAAQPDGDAGAEPPQPSRSGRPAQRAVAAVAAVGVSVGLVAWLLSGVDLDRAREVLRNANPWWLLVALLVNCVSPYACAYRWLCVIRTCHDVVPSFALARRATFLSLVLNSFIPSKGGDLAKAVYLRNQCGLVAGFGTVVVERMVDLAILGALGAAGGLIAGALWGVGIGAAIVTAMAGVFVLLVAPQLHRWFVPRPLRKKFAQGAAVAAQWLRSPSSVAGTLFGAIVSWGVGALSFCAFLCAFGYGEHWAYALCVFPLGILAGLLPFTMSGVGTRDAAYVSLLAVVAIPAEEATLVSFGYTICGYWLLSLMGLPSVLSEARAWLRERNETASPGLAPTEETPPTEAVKFDLSKANRSAHS